MEDFYAQEWKTLNPLTYHVNVDGSYTTAQGYYGNATTYYTRPEDIISNRTTYNVSYDYVEHMIDEKIEAMMSRVYDIIAEHTTINISEDEFMQLIKEG